MSSKKNIGVIGPGFLNQVPTFSLTTSTPKKKTVEAYAPLYFQYALYLQLQERVVETGSSIAKEFLPYCTEDGLKQNLQRPDSQNKESAVGG